MLKDKINTRTMATFGGLFLAGLLGAAVPGAWTQSTMQQSQNNGQNNGQMSSNAQSTVTASDRMFARSAATGGMAEVKMGQLAEQKGSNQAVKDFGKHMVQDHSKADDQLKQLAQQDNVTLPTGLDAKDQAEYNRLSKLSGPAFDRAYAQAMVQDHVTDISAFQREADRGRNDDLKNFASSTLPTLQSHLNMAKDMRNAVSTSAENQTN